VGINVVEEELGRKSVFMNEEKLSTDYVPPHLIHRDAELRQLAQFFRVLIQTPGSCSKTVSIVGHVGTGKTAIAKRFGDFLEESASLRNINLKYIHINCRKQKTSTLILTTIIRNFSPNTPLRGFSTAELLYLLNEVLEKNNVFLLLVLDEADYLLRKNNSTDFIYDLIRLNDDKLNAIQRISLIVITAACLFSFFLFNNKTDRLENKTINSPKSPVLIQAKSSREKASQINKGKHEKLYVNTADRPESKINHQF